MDPTILKSLQKIEELVKTKKNIIEQIPIKPTPEPTPVILPKPVQVQLPPSYPPSIPNLPMMKPPHMIPPYHAETPLFMNPMGLAPNGMNMGIMQFNDGIMIPGGQGEPIMPFYTENEKINNNANGGKPSISKTTKTPGQTDPNRRKNQQEMEQSAKDKKKKLKTLRKIAGETWEDKTLEDWPENDFRIFCGDLGNEVNDEVLATAFRKYSSFQRARVIRDKRSGKTKGFGFVSLMDPQEYLKALTEMNGKYVGNRPIKIRKSTWKDRGLVGGKFNSDAKGRKKLKMN